MISDHISDLMIAVKSKPNGEWRNKVLSHLKDAYACSKAMENEKMGNDTASSPERPVGGLNKRTEHVLNACTCQNLNDIDIDCPEHGWIIGA